MSEVFLSRAAAEAEGFTVDNHVYPWFAYKGPRFRPEQSCDCLTDIEAEMLDVLRDLICIAQVRAPDHNLTLERAHAAIAKAEGRKARLPGDR